MNEAKEKGEQKDSLKSIDRSVLNNFYWSFHHSQGNPTLQSLLSIYLARQFNKDEIGDLKTFEARLSPQIKKLHIPLEHIREDVDKDTGEVYVLDDKRAQEHDAGFQSQWHRLLMVFKRVYYDLPNPREMLWMGGFEGNI